LNEFSLSFVNHAQVVEGSPLAVAIAEFTTGNQAGLIGGDGLRPAALALVAIAQVVKCIA